ncbi:Trypanosome variant surface glycoprotein (A-type), putative [Trypanosoma equiperdum]|uniref:Trypanosome variant surface glycoprotein (A-type), putative n=1 Tax=Trypanosoma equiperdum TaxID=5694 RepID=A0A1G4IA23_TRYEQ|nr:Trypanosome variant surface glycoprotein (A-type), putative [Trypanosoma equiperdum]
MKLKLNFHTKPLCLLLATALLAQVQLTLCSGPIIKNTGRKGLCTAAKTMDKGAGRAVHVLTRLFNTVEKATQTALQIKLYAATVAEPVQQLTYETLAEDVLAIAKEAAASGETATQTAIKATALSAALSGQIKEFLAFIRSGTHGTTEGYCLAASNDGSNGHTEFDSADCKPGTPRTATIAQQIDSAELSATGFKAETEPDSKSTASGGKCIIFNAASNAAATFFQASRPQQTYAGGLLTYNPTTQAIQTPDPAKLGSGGSPTGDTQAALTFSALYAIDKYDLKRYPETQEQIAVQAAQSGSFATRLQTKIRNLHPKITEAKKVEDAAAAIKKYIGDNQEKISLLIAKFPTTKVYKPADNKDKGQNVNELTSLDQLTEVLDYYEQKTRADLATARAELQQLQAQINADKTKITTQICNSKEDAKTCNADKNCKYDENIKEGQKCKLSEEGKQKAAKKKEK